MVWRAMLWPFQHRAPQYDMHTEPIHNICPQFLYTILHLYTFIFMNISFRKFSYLFYSKLFKKMQTKFWVMSWEIKWNWCKLFETWPQQKYLPFYLNGLIYLMYTRQQQYSNMLTQVTNLNRWAWIMKQDGSQQPAWFWPK